MFYPLLIIIFMWGSSLITRDTSYHVPMTPGATWQVEFQRDSNVLQHTPHHTSLTKTEYDPSQLMLPSQLKWPPFDHCIEGCETAHSSRWVIIHNATYHALYYPKQGKERKGEKNHGLLPCLTRLAVGNHISWIKWTTANRLTLSIKQT